MVLFAAVFLLCSPWTLMLNEHIRIDIVNNMFPKRVRNWIDLLGHVFFLLPFTVVMIITGWPFFLRFVSGSTSNRRTPAACAQWPAKLLVPLCFTLAVLPGDIRNHQAHRGHARAHPRSACERAPSALRPRCKN